MRLHISLLCAVLLASSCGIYPEASRHLSDPKYLALRDTLGTLIGTGELSGDVRGVVLVAGSSHTPIVLGETMEIGELALYYDLVVPVIGLQNVDYVSIVVPRNDDEGGRLRTVVLQWNGAQWEYLVVGRLVRE